MTLEVDVHQGKFVNSVNFGRHELSGSGDIMDFLCHVTLQDHVIKALNELMVRMGTA